MYETLLYEVADGIATVTLNRPEKLNAFSAVMHRELMDVLDRIDGDDGVRVAIFTGAGRAFCSGADLTGDSALLKGRDDGDEVGQGDHLDIPPNVAGILALRLFECQKPLIAAINGPAAGVGVTMTLPMDVRMCSTGAKFGFVFTRRGLVLEACSSWFLPRIVGISTAAEWCYAGRMVRVDEALSAGLVRSAHAPDELLPAARELARDFADGTAPVAVASTRQLLWRMLGAPHPMEAHRADSRAMYLFSRSADVKEGVRSFLEKDTPVFPGKVSDGLPDLFPNWVEPEYS